VAQERFPVVWLSKVAVVTLPVEIDIANADRVRDDLLSILNRGAATLIVDMGGTTFCDSAGVNALVRAHKRATANDSDMRLVVGAPAVRRVLDITGVDHLIDIYPSVAASLAGVQQPGPDDKACPPCDAYHAARMDPDDKAAQPG
jgi:anti-sigma B factor antagonist